MLTVKEFKDLGVVFVVGDFINSAGAKDQPLKSCGADYCNSGSNESFIVYGFTWRPLNTLPDNPKFKYEVDTDIHSWRPLLDQSEVKVSDDKPVFTQAMADVGELPPVGSVFLYCHLANPEPTDWHEVVSKYTDDDCIFFKGENGVKGFANKEDLAYKICKPLDTRTPKQKAVDDIEKWQQSHDKLTDQNKVLREVLYEIANEAKSYQEKTDKSITWLERATKALEW